MGRNAGRCPGVATTTLTRILNGQGRVTSEMAVRLERVLGRSALSWMRMQDNYDLWQACQSLNIENLRPLVLQAA